MLQESPEEAFEEWVAVHDKAYATEGERAHRAAVWRDNLAYIQAYNAQETTHWVRAPPSVSLSPHAVAAPPWPAPARAIQGSTGLFRGIWRRFWRGDQLRVLVNPAAVDHLTQHTPRRRPCELPAVWCNPSACGLGRPLPRSSRARLVSLCAAVTPAFASRGSSWETQHFCLIKHVCALCILLQAQSMLSACTIPHWEFVRIPEP